MDTFKLLQQIANDLDDLGLIRTADKIDSYLKKAQTDRKIVFAQEAKDKNQAEPLSRTTYLMLTDLRDFYVSNLMKMKYLGEKDLKNIQAGVDQMTTMYRVVLRNMAPEYNNQQVLSYQDYLEGLKEEAERASKMDINPARVTIEKSLYYDPLDHIVKKIERHYDAGIKELKPVLLKARAIRSAFANLIQHTSEEIAHSDLIRIQ